MSTEAVRRDLGEILAHGEPEHGIGQGEVADQAAQPASRAARRPERRPAPATATGNGDVVTSTSATSDRRPPDERLNSSRCAGAARPQPPRRSRPRPQLAARIQCPRRLPARYDGQPLAAPLALVLQPLRRSARRTGAGATSSARRPRRPGRCSSAARSTTRITLYYRHILDHGERLSARPGQGRLPRRLESRRSRPSASKLGHRLGEPTCARTARSSSAVDAVELAFSRADPAPRRAGRRPAPGSSTRSRPGSSGASSATSTSRRQAARRRRADAGGRRLQGQEHAADASTRPTTTSSRPCTSPGAGWKAIRPRELLLRPDRQARPAPQADRAPRSSTTSRSTGQLRGALARIAQVARQIVACYERFGPDQPWGFADPQRLEVQRRATATRGSAPAEPGSKDDGVGT